MSWLRPSLIPVLLAGAVGVGMFTLPSCGISVADRDDDSPTPSGSPSPGSDITPEPTPEPVTINIAAEPNSLRFGTVEQSESKTLTVFFRNAGTLTYNIREYQLTQTFPAYSATWYQEERCTLPPSKLAPGESVGVNVTFRPAQPGNFKASLTLLTEQGDNPSVAITGTGASYDPTNDSPTPEPTAIPEPCN